MPRQLNIFTGTANQTVNAEIQRLSDGLWFNGSTWESYADAHFSTYAVALTGDGAGNYVGSLPGTFPAILDSYHVIYTLQTGGSPAFTDAVLYQQDLVWDGVTASVTDVYALSTLSAAKAQMRFATTANDAELVGIINSASAMIERVCGRKFLARQYQEFYNGNKQRRLVLRNSPLNSVDRVAYGRQTAFYATFTGTAVRANAGVTTTGIQLVSMTAGGTKTVTDLSFVQYPTVSTLVTAIKAVSGWTAVASTDLPSAELYPTGGQDAIGVQVFFTYPLFGTLEYLADFSRSTLEFTRGAIWPNERGWHGEILQSRVPQGFRQIFVQHNSGYKTVPTDVAQQTRNLIQNIWNTNQSDSTKQQVKIGPMAYTNFAPSERALTGIRDQLMGYITDASQFVGGV